MPAHRFGNSDPDDPNNNKQNDHANNPSNLSDLLARQASLQAKSAAMSNIMSSNNDVQDLLIDYHQKAKHGDFKPVQFRDDILEKMLITLSTTKHPNPLLTGEAGVGKTAIVEELARRLFNRDPLVCSMLDPKTKIYELPISSLISNTQYRGQLEAKVKSIIDFIKDPQNHAILYIDEIHQIVNESNDTNNSISQLLKPALSRGDMHVIASTTTQEARTLKRDPAFNRRFSTIIVPELSNEETFAIIKDASLVIQKQHHVNMNISDNLYHHIIAKANEYATSYQSHRPDTALTILDQSISAAILQNHKVSINQNMNNNSLPLVLTTKLIDNTALMLLNAYSPKLNLDELKDRFDTKIIGQTQAKQSIINDIAGDKLHLYDQKKPHSYLFAGPTGTGKTEIAKQLANVLFGNENNMITINMTEYSSDSSITRLIGSSRGYVGSQSNQPLPLDPLINNPFQIVLLDEFEKASGSVQKLFMQALDEGYIRYANETVISFKQAIIIATTNAGYEDLNQNSVGFNQDHDVHDSQLMRVLSRYFPPELMNRFEHIAYFNSITLDEYKQILKIKYNDLIKQASVNNPTYNLSPKSLSFDEDYDFIDILSQQSYDPMKNGRPAERTMKQAILKQLLQNPNQIIFDFTDCDFNQK